jgi:hypothetical protein
MLLHWLRHSQQIVQLDLAKISTLETALYSISLWMTPLAYCKYQIQLHFEDTLDCTFRRNNTSDTSRIKGAQKWNLMTQSAQLIVFKVDEIPIWNYMLSIRVCTKQKLHLTTKHPFQIALWNNTSRRKSNKNTGCRISPTKIPVVIYCCVATGTSLFSSPYHMETRSAKTGDRKNKRKKAVITPT